MSKRVENAVVFTIISGLIVIALFVFVSLLIMSGDITEKNNIIPSILSLLSSIGIFATIYVFIKEKNERKEDKDKGYRELKTISATELHEFISTSTKLKDVLQMITESDFDTLSAIVNIDEESYTFVAVKNTYCIPNIFKLEFNPIKRIGNSRLLLTTVELPRFKTFLMEEIIKKSIKYDLNLYLKLFYTIDSVLSFQSAFKLFIKKINNEKVSPYIAKEHSKSLIKFINKLNENLNDIIKKNLEL